MRTIRIGAWLAVAALIAVVGYVALNERLGGSVAELAGASIGGPFTLQRTDGTTVTEKDLMGRPHAIFFGFTHCPEVCPTTLWEASGWLGELGGDADRFAFYFVTVDPERDTAEVLAQYMTSFDARIAGLTGTPEQVEQIKTAYRVYSRKVVLDDGDYTVDHTATVYLMHGDGRFAGTIAYGEDTASAVAKLRRLVKDG